jgi:hypothetical protein
MDLLPTDVQRDILSRAGAWIHPAGGTRHTSVLSVCRLWRDTVSANPADMANFLVAVRGKVESGHILEGGALMAAVRMGNAGAACHILEVHGAPPLGGFWTWAFVFASQRGSVAITRLLLAHWPEKKEAERLRTMQTSLGFAASYGHDALVRMVLDVRDVCAITPSPRADHDNGSALVSAANSGRVDVVTTLLTWHVNPPRADCSNGEALVRARRPRRPRSPRRGGHEGVVRILLQHWPVDAPIPEEERVRAYAKRSAYGRTPR